MNYLVGTSAHETYSKAREASDRGLALSPDLAAAHLARADLLQNADLDWRGAEAEFRRAIALAPNDGEAKFGLGTQLAACGQLESAMEHMRQALVTYPLQHIWYAWLASLLSTLNRFDEAEWTIHRAIELQPAAVFHHYTLTIIEVQRGNAQAALTAAQQEPPGRGRTSLSLSHDRSAETARRSMRRLGR